ncbi:MAG TPA: YdeI/OmpD-associated family protein [Bacteroidia bacterium]|jgi:uncharacterized protein YdeI (YjbR/CyaY-like superfamily)|nr:YdeI/OmpD-associated family protein [Bacteroidia bacterium]HQF27911.1 YdeI/OmpD-associated family protein [Bacteroidia bacterium]HQK97804.1 YdeI/OmpD-associated family protein [Bacteroidia bacterium]
MQKKETTIFYPKSTKEWRKWLEKNHQSHTSVWVVFFNKSSKKKTISWSEAVDEALCFGWIDSKKIKIDEESSHQFFSKRKAISTWSKINKEKIKRLIEENKMSKAGNEIIEIAKKNGSWEMLDEVEELKVPTELNSEFETNPTARDFFNSLSKSNRKMILHWIVMAKRSETKQNRIKEIIERGNQNLKPKHIA